MPIRGSGGLVIHDAYGRHAIAHGGAINGFFPMAYYYPDEGLVIVLQNTMRQHAGGVR